jgi:D-glycerate 3-kinase
MIKVPNESHFRRQNTNLRRQLNVLFGEELLHAVLDEILDCDFPDWACLASVIGAKMLASDTRVLAVSGSQGSGKSTFADVLVKTLEATGARAAALSIDDFYLTQAARIALSESVHPLLRTRGVPGTHDAELLLETLLAHRSGRRIRVPRFDKGRDDRQGEVTLEVDFLVLEGWCVGVEAEAAGALTNPVNALERDEDSDAVWRHWVNAQVRRYTPSWRAVDYWVQLRAPSFTQVYEWRAEQEQTLRSEEQMSPPELQRFIQHYERLTRHLWSAPPHAPGLVVNLDANHVVSEITLV